MTIERGTAKRKKVCAKQSVGAVSGNHQYPQYLNQVQQLSTSACYGSIEREYLDSNDELRMLAQLLERTAYADQSTKCSYPPDINIDGSNSC